MLTAIYQDHPCRVIVSDQGSTDGSLEVINRVAARESGNPVEVLQCPEQQYIGMPGFNLHMNWIHTQIDGDIVVVCSADDYVMPSRVRDTVNAFDKHDVDFVLTANRFEEEDGTCYGYSPKEQSGYVGLAEMIRSMIGGSAAQNWRRSFWEGLGGMSLFPGFDMVLPHVAAARGRCYYVNNPTHVYVRHVATDNTGLESVALAAKDESELDAVHELMAFHRMTGILDVIAHCPQYDNADDFQAVIADLIGVAGAWRRAREILSVRGIPPKLFPMLLPARTDGALPKVVNG